jgi:hypothetical protein
VGALGQARLGQLVLVTPAECSTKEAQFAQLYAERCGMMPASTQVGTASTVDITHQVPVKYPIAIAAHYKHEASAVIGVGAAIALTQVVAALFDQSQVIERTDT